MGVLGHVTATSSERVFWEIWEIGGSWEARKRDILKHLKEVVIVPALIFNIIVVHTRDTLIGTAVERHSTIHFSYIVFPLIGTAIMFPNLCENERFRTGMVPKVLQCRDDAVRPIRS